MGIQGMMDAIGEASSMARSGYHLTFGELIEALKSINKDLDFDGRVVGIGSYRGYYTDIALYTQRDGGLLEDEEYSGGYEEHEEWRKEHQTQIGKLPRNSYELGVLLESFIGKDFIGYKGGNFTITKDKSLWLAEDSSDCSDVAVVGVNDDLTLMTGIVD